MKNEIRLKKKKERKIGTLCGKKNGVRKGVGKKEWEENDVNGKRSKNNYNWIRCFTSVGRAGKAVVIIKSVNKEGGIYRTSHAKSNRILNSDREIHIERVGGREKYFSIPC